MDDLFEAAQHARDNAYAPYSGYTVGAALIDDRGQLHIGCNVENASFPEGNCAETSAIAAMVVSGGRTIRNIAVVGGHDALEACTPCGGCRQRIAEFANEDTQVGLIEGNGARKTLSIAELLPLGFRLK